MIRALFTKHELAVLRLLVRGRTQVQIARTLRIRPETVSHLLNRPRILLRARTLPHAVARGYETGLLGQPPDSHGARQEGHRRPGPCRSRPLAELVMESGRLAAESENATRARQLRGASGDGRALGGEPGEVNLAQLLPRRAVFRLPRRDRLTIEPA